MFGIFDYFRLLKRMNRLESAISEDILEYLEGLEELENRISGVEHSLQGHMASEKRWDKVRNSPNGKAALPQPINITGGNNEIKDESVQQYISEMGSNPRDDVLRLIREGKWK